MPRSLLAARRGLITARNYRGPVFVMAFMVFFWTVFDSTMSYLTPLLITERGFSNTAMGLIYGTSSVAGALFDLLVCRIFKQIFYRRIFLAMLLICSVYPLILWQAKTVPMFVFAMVVWGVYFDLYGFGIFDFIGRCTPKPVHSSSFGIIQVFRNLGGVVAPLLVGLVVVGTVDWKAFGLGWVALLMSAVMFGVLVLIMSSRTCGVESYCSPGLRSFWTELHLWRKIGKTILPSLILTFFLFFIEAFFWTLAPLYAGSADLGRYGGLFLTAFTFPALIMGWQVGRLNRRFGKKNTAFFGLLVGSLVLSTFSFWHHPLAILAVTFVSSCFVGVALPSINAAYADYISEAADVEGEIETLEDVSFNIGYVLGPVTAGFLADMIGIPHSFVFLGAAGAVIATGLLVFTPKKIAVRIRTAETR